MNYNTLMENDNEALLRSYSMHSEDKRFMIYVSKWDKSVKNAPMNLEVCEFVFENGKRRRLDIYQTTCTCVIDGFRKGKKWIADLLEIEARIEAEAQAIEDANTLLQDAYDDMNSDYNVDVPQYAII